MSVSEISSVWNILLKYPFVVKDNVISDDLKCIICKKFAVDAVLSGICGCTFCYKCISDYTNESEKYCPGNKPYCHDQHIVLGDNACRNPMLNKRITKVKVNCPNETCDCKLELIEMSQHLSLCTKQPFKCPYVNIGCITASDDKDMIVNHLHGNILPHSELLIDLIQNLKNDVDYLKNELQNSKLVIVSLKEESMERENKMAKLVEKLENAITEVFAQKQEIDGIRDEMGNLKTVFSKCEEENKIEIMRLKDKIVGIEKQLKDELNKVEIRVSEESKERNREFDEQRRQIKDTEIEREKLATCVNDLLTDIDNLKNDENTARRIDNLVKFCPNIDADFAWRFDECSTKIDKSSYSLSFYSNNYKLCLWAHFYGNGNIGLWCDIMKGDNDDMVEWPMKRVVTLSIVNQDTLRTHVRETFHTEFKKPEKDKEAFVGTSYFIKYSSIIDNPSIVVNDSIVVSCVINNP